MSIRITYLVGSISRRSGGLYDANRFAARELVRSGCQVTAIGVRDTDSEADVVGWGDVTVRLTGSLGPRRFGFAPELNHLLKQAAPDILHSHGLWSYTSKASLNWQRATGKPVVIHPHGMLDPWALRHSLLKKRIVGCLFERQHLRAASCVRALCVAEAEAIRSFGLSNPIAIIPNGIDLPSESIAPAATIASTNGRKTLLFLSRIHPKKGLVNLIKAWAETSAHKDWRLIVAGWDELDHENDLKRLAVSLDLKISDERAIDQGKGEDVDISFIGPQFGDAKMNLYRRCDAFVLPSYSEGLPMVVLEAWAYGKPVLMTHFCNLPDGFERHAAIRIEPEPSSIKEGILQLANLSDADRIAMGQRGRALVMDRFTWTEVAASLLAVSRWLVHGDVTPSCVILD